MRIPTRVIYSILGVPEVDINCLSKASAIGVGTSGTTSETDDAELFDYIVSSVKDQIRNWENPSYDLISKLVVRLLYLVLFAGNAALINLIPLSIISLLLHSE